MFMKPVPELSPAAYVRRSNEVTSRDRSKLLPMRFCITNSRNRIDITFKCNFLFDFSEIDIKSE